MVTIEEMVDGIITDYDFEITIKRKSDGYGTRLPLNELGLVDIFKTDFLAQLISHIKYIKEEAK